MRVPRTTLTLLVATVALAGCGGDGADDRTAEVASLPDGTILIEAGDLYFDPEAISAPAGTVVLGLDNVGAIVHDVVIEEAGDEQVVLAQAGETATGSIDLEAGTYTYYCSVPGHRNAMEGTLEVD